MSWADAGFHVAARWAPRVEEPGEIAAWVGPLVDRLGGLLGVSWVARPAMEPWPEDPKTQADWVAAGVARDDVGTVSRESGFAVHLYAKDRRGFWTVALSVKAGAQWAPSRLPLDRVLLTVRVPDDGAEATAMAALRAVIECARPDDAALRNTALAKLTRRFGWQVPVGWGTYISDRVGTLDPTGTGFTVKPFVGGQLATCPDDWTAEQVGEAGLRMLAQSGVDEIAH